MNRPEKPNLILSALERLNAELATLAQTARDKRPSTVSRQKIDSGLRTLITRAETLTRDLDPIRHPRFVFDPSDPSVVGRFIALAMIAQPRAPLSDVERFYGSGVYALYFRGPFPIYSPIKDTETPIYVGKADPRSENARTPKEQGDRLARRLGDHRRTIAKARDTLNIDMFDCRFLVVQSGWQTAAEAYLVQLFRPVWNSETGICYGFGKHGDAPSTRSNLRSPWDTLHPGRDWAWRDPKMEDARHHDRIVADLKAHFSTTPTYQGVGQVLDGFVNELQQL